MLARLRLGTLGAVDEQDGTVHLRRARDHVLHEVRVAGAVDVRVVPGGRLVLDVRQVDGDATHPLLGRAVDLRAVEAATAMQRRHHLRDGRRERGLTVVHMSDGADVHMQLAHGFSSLKRTGPAENDSENEESPLWRAPEGLGDGIRGRF